MPSASRRYNIGEPFTEFNVIESTNNYAMALARTHAATHGAAIFSHYQTAGKGQRGKQWNAAEKQNIILSVLLDMKWLAVSKNFLLSAAIALGVYDFFSKYSQGNTFIKWPNDIYWNDRKAAGILIENLLRGNDWQWSVAGIGININQIVFDENLKNPVSLKQITGKDFDTVALAKELCAFLQKRFLQLQDQEEEMLLKNYNEVLYKKDELVKLKKDNVEFNCVIKAVNIFGQLIVESTAKQAFDFGEIEWVIG